MYVGCDNVLRDEDSSTAQITDPLVPVQSNVVPGTPNVCLCVCQLHTVYIVCVQYF